MCTDRELPGYDPHTGVIDTGLLADDIFDHQFEAYANSFQADWDYVNQHPELDRLASKPFDPEILPF